MNAWSRWVAALCGVLSISAAGIVAAADRQELLRVLDPNQPPADSRLTHPRDLDHPAVFAPEFHSRGEWEKRATALREQILVAEGLWPMPAKPPLEPVIHGRIDRDDYTVEKVYFASMPGHYVTGNLYRPKHAPEGGRSPAVLCPHGHWPDGRFMWTSDDSARQQVDSGAEKTLEGAHAPLQARCATLARMGCVVFHYDMIGYADSGPIEHRKGFTDAESVLRLQSTMGLQTWNSIRVLDFVLSLPDVDPQRIAVTGASGGGTQSFVLGAIDDRLAVACPAVMVSMNMQGGCVCENAPLLRMDTDNVEIAALFAPRPLGMTAANDWTSDLETKGLPELKSIYRLYGADDRVAARHFPFPHNYNQVSREYVYNFLNDHLKLGQPTPVREKPFEPVPPKELSVYDAEHPQPADAQGADGLRRRMTDSSDTQLSQLASDVPKYRKVMSTALRVMLCEPAPGLPSNAHVLAGRMSGPMPMEAVVAEKGYIRRDGTAEHIPTAALFPLHWNGVVVVWAHPAGKGSLFEGDQLNPAAKSILDSRAAVLSADLFLTGEFGHAAEPAASNPAPKAQDDYAAFTLGYNRSILANRVHDLLSVLALARGWDGTKSVRLVGFGQAGPWALLARAAAGDAIDRTAVDLDEFDFDRVHSDSDPMLLPGALKYGGIYGFVPLCNGGTTLIAGARKTGKWSLAAATQGVTLREAKAGDNELVDWLMREQ